MRARFYFLLFFVVTGLLLPSFAKAQLAFGFQQPRYSTAFLLPVDTIIKPDTLKGPKARNPKTAAILSAVVPGLGQIYNRKWWKLPIIYAGFGGLTYGFVWNNNLYRQYHEALLLRYDDDPATVDDFPLYTDDNLITLKNYYQRYRDLCVIGASALYTLQILDAAVDAHLSTFNVNDDLSLHVQPMLYPGPQNVTGMIGLRLSFR